MADSLPERIKMKITIEIDAPSDALEEIPKMIDNAIDGVKFGLPAVMAFSWGKKGPTATQWRTIFRENQPRLRLCLKCSTASLLLGS